MRKLMMLGAMLGIVLLAAVPAIAQVSQESSQEDVESGDVEPSVEIVNKGNNVNICGTVHQSANSGNVQNIQGVTQYLAYTDDIEFEGSNITFETESAGECTQTISQAATASG